jgi:hypothetical protein
MRTELGAMADLAEPVALRNTLGAWVARVLALLDVVEGATAWKLARSKRAVLGEPFAKILTKDTARVITRRTRRVERLMNRLLAGPFRKMEPGEDVRLAIDRMASSFQEMEALIRRKFPELQRKIRDDTDARAVLEGLGDTRFPPRG